MLGAVVIAACANDEPPSVQSSGDAEGGEVERLDCGQGNAGGERALKTFLGVLRRGDAEEIEAVLAKPGRFEWISAHVAGSLTVSVRQDPAEAAREVAHLGGLPITITHIQNSEQPTGSTDLGFVGRWDDARHLNGKATIDCVRGKARVLSVGVPP